MFIPSANGIRNNAIGRPVATANNVASARCGNGATGCKIAGAKAGNGNFTGGVNIGNSTTNGGFTNASFHWSYNTNLTGWKVLVGKQIEVYAIPESAPEGEFRGTVALPRNMTRQREAYYVKACWLDGHSAWSSPVYIERD